jgi:hypothetical protein
MKFVHRELLKSMRWAKETTIAHGSDITLLQSVGAGFSETDLLRELAWVVLCSGFRERVVRRSFSKISLCFLDWRSAREITEQAKLCVSTALDVFGSRRKIEAIATSAKKIDNEGFKVLQQRINADPIETLREFPYIGEITAFHLAKNIGFDLAKPDRHLVRIAEAHGYDCVQSFCAAVASVTGDPVHVIDTVLWRISELGMADRLKFNSISLRRPSPPKQQFFPWFDTLLKRARGFLRSFGRETATATKVRLPA